jgi:hypothetical protein
VDPGFACQAVLEHDKVALVERTSEGVRALADELGSKADSSHVLCNDVFVSVPENLPAQLPGEVVVEAFETVFAGCDACPSENSRLLDAFAAADPAVKAKVVELVRSLDEMTLVGIAFKVRLGWLSACKLGATGEKP